MAYTKSVAFVELLLMSLSALRMPRLCSLWKKCPRQWHDPWLMTYIFIYTQVKLVFVYSFFFLWQLQSLRACLLVLCADAQVQDMRLPSTSIDGILLGAKVQRQRFSSWQRLQGWWSDALRNSEGFCYFELQNCQICSERNAPKKTYGFWVYKVWLWSKSRDFCLVIQGIANADSVALGPMRTFPALGRLAPSRRSQRFPTTGTPPVKLARKDEN